MGGLAKGIEANKGKVVSAIKGLSTDISIGVNPSTAINGNKANTTTTNYASLLHTDKVIINNGMDIKTLAEELNFYMKQKSTATGGAY